jgi:hypothetical protein
MTEDEMNEIETSAPLVGRVGPEGGGMTPRMLARYRFVVYGVDDYRPVSWPPPGPYWCSGYTDEGPIVIAYAASEEEVLRFWPEASGIDELRGPVALSDIVFTGRFPMPDWWADLGLKGEG